MAWKKGQSGNPQGRTKGSHSLAEIRAELLKNENLDRVIATLIEKAVAGEAWAVKLYLDKLIPNAQEHEDQQRLPEKIELRWAGDTVGDEFN